jgi:hypothetical protein
MKGKLIGWLALIALIMIPVSIFACGVAFADDGTGTAGSDWSPLWIAIGAIAVTLLNLYWDCLKPRLQVIWAVTTDGAAWKLRCSLIALGLALWDMLKAAYKKGLLDAIISIFIGIIKRKFGIPAAAKAAAKQADKIFPGP